MKSEEEIRNFLTVLEKMKEEADNDWYKELTNQAVEAVKWILED